MQGSVDPRIADQQICNTFHEGIRPLQQFILLTAGKLCGEISRGEEWVVIATQHMERVAGALGQCRCHVAGG